MGKELTISEAVDKLTALINTTKFDIKEEITKAVSDLTSKIEETHKKITELEKENKTLKKSLEEAHKQIKKNNLIIFGLEESEDEDVYETVVKFIKEKLKVQVNKSEINHIYKFGNREKIRPTVVKFVSFHRKIDVLRNAYNLKNSNYSVANDLTRKERELQKELIGYLREVQKQDPTAKIKQNKIATNDTYYSLDELRQLEITKPIEVDKTVTQNQSESKPSTSNQRKIITAQLKDKRKDQPYPLRYPKK